MENGNLQPRTRLYGCSTRRTLSVLCKCRIVVRFHPLCPKRAAAPWHTGAKSKVKVHANKWILCDKGVSILHRLRYFEQVISPVACFGASHRAIHKYDLAKLDVEYRR